MADFAPVGGEFIDDGTLLGHVSYGDLLEALRKDLQLDPLVDLLPTKGLALTPQSLPAHTSLIWDGTKWTPAAPPARAYRNAALAAAGPSWTKIPLDTVHFDPGSHFTLPDYVCPVTGYYQVTGNVTWAVPNGAAGTIEIGCGVWPNNSPGAVAGVEGVFFVAENAAGGTLGITSVVAAVIPAQAGDSLALYQWQTAATYGLITASYINYFCVQQVG